MREGTRVQQIRVPQAEAGRRIDKYLMKYFDAAPKSFIYKAFRKKNIKLCGKRAAGNELLNEGDLIELFFSDETIASMRKTPGGVMSGKTATNGREQRTEHSAGAYTAVRSSAGIVHGGNADLTWGYNKANNSISTVKQTVLGRTHKVSAGDKAALRKYCEIVYEDKDVIFADKRENVLSQKAEPGDYSLNEALLDYCGGKPEASSFVPSVCNRIDRNTTGLICFAKSYKAARLLSEMLRDRSLEKYYLAAVSGVVSEAAHVEAWLVKDKKSNKVTVSDRPSAGAEHIETAFRPIDGAEAEVLGIGRAGVGELFSSTDREQKIDSISTEFYKPKLSVNDIATERTSGLNRVVGANKNVSRFASSKLGKHPYTLVKVELITGKSHQIRAQLAALGHPLLGDPKYGSRELNKHFAEAYGIRSQLLHAWEMHFPEDTPSPLDPFAGKSVRTKTPEWVKMLRIE